MQGLSDSDRCRCGCSRRSPVPLRRSESRSASRGATDRRRPQLSRSALSRRDMGFEHCREGPLSIAVAGLRPLNPAAGQTAPVLVWSGPAFSKPLRLPGHSIVVFSLAYDPPGEILASSGDEEPRLGKAPVKVWDRKSEREAFPVEAFEGNLLLFSVAFSHDGRWLVGGGSGSQDQGLEWRHGSESGSGWGAC